MSGSDDQLALVRRLSQRLIEAKCKIATVESCTGGSVSALFTELAGSSAWFDRGFVTYTNQAKYDMVNVDRKTLVEHGAVSERVAGEMAAGGLLNSEADMAISITGIAGPEGGSRAKPVGMVCFGWALGGQGLVTKTQYFEGDRAAVRAQSVNYVVSKAIRFLN